MKEVRTCRGLFLNRIGVLCDILCVYILKASQCCYNLQGAAFYGRNEVYSGKKVAVSSTDYFSDRTLSQSLTLRCNTCVCDLIGAVCLVGRVTKKLPAGPASYPGQSTSRDQWGVSGPVRNSLCIRAGVLLS